MAKDLEQETFELYQLAKENPQDENLQRAVSILKSTRRSRGSLQAWNDRYRGSISELDQQIQTKEQENADLQEQLSELQAEMNSLVQERARLIGERQKAIAELKKIDTEVKMAVAQVKSSKTWYGKFSTLWTFIHGLFLDDEDFGEVDHSLEADPDKPQLGSSVADVQRSLLDK